MAEYQLQILRSHCVVNVPVLWVKSSPEVKSSNLIPVCSIARRTCSHNEAEFFLIPIRSITFFISNRFCAAGPRNGVVSKWAQMKKDNLPTNFNLSRPANFLWLRLINWVNIYRTGGVWLLFRKEMEPERRRLNVVVKLRDILNS